VSSLQYSKGCGRAGRNVECCTFVQVLRVRSCLAGSAARAALRDGDLLLSVAGRPVSHFRAVEAAVDASFSPATPAQANPIKIAPSSEMTAGGSADRQDSTELASEGTVFQIEGAKRGAANSSGAGPFKRQRIVSGARLDLTCTASDANTIDAHAMTLK
jgi:hypothetical protein